jgi:hypothetical protein
MFEFEFDQSESSRIASEMRALRERANHRTRAVWVNFEVFEESECLESWSLDEAIGSLARTIGR